MSTKRETVAVEIIDDDEEQEQEQEQECVKIKPNPRKKRETHRQVLKPYFREDPSIFEIGVDEAGRGPLFGRVYTAAVILPKDNSFDHSKMKDSKKFHSKKKILEVAEYIKANAIAWSVTFETEIVIDEINILQATQRSMHHSIVETMKHCFNSLGKQEYQLLIDGNYFKAFTKEKGLDPEPFCSNFRSICIEGGDNTYSAIAAASILAKVSRDQYIEELCQENPELIEKYGIDSNKGYGAKRHIDGIKEHGITIWHRRTFGICSTF
uniref:Ribonuclease HII n=1 Tax=viral metagenome TaxID=1070528 RepID=A0A6C0E335_9ZZZZ